MVPRETGVDTKLNRRQYLLAAGTAATLGLAGCNEVTSYEFEATPIGLPSKAAENLVVAELDRSSETQTHNFEVGEVSITSHSTTYHRGPARGQPTLMEAFAGRVNGTEGAGASKLVPGSALDWGPDPALEPDRVSLIVPAGAVMGRQGDSEDVGITPENVLVLMNSETEIEHSTGATSDSSGSVRYFSVPVGNAFPNKKWDGPIDTFDPSNRWWPGAYEQTANSEDRIFVTVGPDDSFEGVFGQPPEAFDAPQNSYDELPSDTLLVMPGNVAFQDSGSFLSVAPGTGPYEYPAPMGGATYGLRALATPRAEVAGDPQNPLATEDLATILERDDAQKLLEGAGLSEAEDIRWLAGPEELETAGGKLQDHANPDLADSDGEYRTFTGVVNSRENTEVNWLVALHVARVESDGDVVIAGGVNRIWVPFRGPYDEMIPTDTEETPWGPWFNSGAEMTAACLNRLARREELS